MHILKVRRGSRAVMFGAMMTAVPMAAQAADTAWSGAVDVGDWFVAGNWTNGVPDATTNLTSITIGGTAVISDGAANAGTTLDIGGGSALEVFGGSLTAGTVELDPDGELLFSGADASLAPTTKIAMNGGKLNLDGASITVGELSGSLGTVGIGGTLTVSQASNTTFGGTVGGDGILAKAGTGTLTLSGTNTYTGGTSLLGGTLAVTADSNLGDASGGLSFGGGTLQFGAAFDLAATRAIVLNAGGGTIDTNSFSTTIGQAVTGTGGLTKIGAGTLTLSGANTYTGGTSVLGGTLAVSSDANLGDAGGGLSFGGGTLQFGAAFDLSATRAIVLNAGGGSIDTNGFATTIAQAVTGTGGLTKAGAGTLTLSGSNTYTGATSINTGTLSVGNGGTTGTLGAGVVIDQTTLAINRSNAVTFANAISGAGELRQIGIGTTSLTGTNTYTGTTTISAGTLSVGNGGTTGTLGTGAVVDQATLAVNRSNAITLANAISGAGVILLSGGGTVTLTNTANSYAGGIVVRGGSTLLADADGELGEPHGGVTLGDSTTAGTFKFGASFNLSATRAVVLAGAGTFDTNGFNSTLAQAVSGSGALTVTGAGTLTLSAANTYTGATVVNGGTLSVTGSIAASSGVTVNTGATLAGTGTVAKTTIASGGKLSPGVAGIGTLSVSGPLTFASGAIFLVDANAATADRVTVTGAATLAGTLTATVVNTPAAGTKVTVLSATGGVSGTFQLANATPLGSVGPTLSYDANDAFLLYQKILLPTAAAGSSNTANVIGGVNNAITAGDTLPADVVSLGTLSASALDAKAATLTGEIGATLPGLGATAANEFLTVLMTQAGDLDTDLGSRSSARSNTMAVLGNPAGSVAAPFQAAMRGGPDNASLWLSAFGGHSDTKADLTIGSHDARTNTTGIAGGADFLIERGFIVGVAAAGGHTNFALNSTLGSGKDNALQFGAYAMKRFGPLYLSGAGAYGMQDVTTTRVITGAGAATLNGKVRAIDYSGRLEAGVRLRLPGFGMTPYFAVQTNSYHTPTYTETAAAGGSSTFALIYAARTLTTTRYEFGAGFDTAADLSRHVSLHLYGRAAYAHDTNGTATHVAFAALPGSDFTVQGALPGANSGLFSLGAELRGQNGLSLGLKLDSAVTQHSSAYFGTLDFRYSW